LPYEFAKVSFDLDWMTAAEMVEELKPLGSTHAKFSPMTGSNRIEVVDLVQNLRQIDELLSAEQSDTSRDRLVRNFEIRHVRGDMVRQKLLEMLSIEQKPGMGSSGRRNRGGGGMEMMMMQMQQQMQ